MQYRKVLYSRHEKIITITLTVQCGLHLSDEQPSRSVGESSARAAVLYRTPLKYETEKLV